MFQRLLPQPPEQQDVFNFVWTLNPWHSFQNLHTSELLVFHTSLAQPMYTVHVVETE